MTLEVVGAVTNVNIPTCGGDCFLPECSSGLGEMCFQVQEFVI